ncbi:uncharacterized protein MONOS_18177 [Monocercomonoides exilis]|uniref:uncharacterized protein n=1 Tax=Monocercomonoides exilis TaxID=2049356 RepID=UPI00355A3614|nr:hypothetical protein MONOS_18177 [Monocercomonoides exilis]
MSEQGTAELDDHFAARKACDRRGDDYISSGQLEAGHVGIDHNVTRSSSPSVFEGPVNLQHLTKVFVKLFFNNYSKCTSS